MWFDRVIDTIPIIYHVAREYSEIYNIVELRIPHFRLSSFRERIKDLLNSAMFSVQQQGIQGTFARSSEISRGERNLRNFVVTLPQKTTAFPRGAPTSTRARAERNTSAKIVSTICLPVAAAQFITHLLLICSFLRINLSDVFLRLCTSWHWSSRSNYL